MPIYCKGEACLGKKKQASYGLPNSTKRKWCGTCAKGYGGVLLCKGQSKQMCVDCQDKRANYGLPNTTERRWCGTCAERHGGVLLSKRQMCEDCHVKHASFGVVGNRKRRWCGTWPLLVAVCPSLVRQPPDRLQLQCMRDET